MTLLKSLPPLAFCLLAFCGSLLSAQRLDELDLDRWAMLSETQRYQLQIAEKYFRERNYKVAASEYEKYLTLYEDSEAAAYAQLKWSICQVELRQSNTAIKDGFQSVVDYWPDAPEAVAAGYYIGSTYKGMGRITEAKKALRAVVADHPDHLASVYAMNELIDIAAQEEDDKSRVEYWKKLAFDVTRNKLNARICLDASRSLATHLFSQAALDAGVEALATSYDAGLALDDQVAALVLTPIHNLTSNDESNTQGEKLAAAAIAYFRGQMPTDADDEAKQAALAYWFHVAAVHAYAKHDLEVPKTYEQVFTSFGPNDEILRRLAEWHKSKGQYDEARAAYRRYSDKNAGLNQVAYSYRQQNNVDSAVATYNQLMGQDGDNKVQWQAEIAATYRGARKYQEAINAYDGLMAQDIENAEKWRWQIATAYQDWGKFTEAIGHYRQCTNFPENYKQMATCHRRLKKPEEALILYNQVMADEASAPWALLQMGYTREEAGQKEQAIQTFQLVCKRFPKHAYASTAHAHLQNEYKISVTLGGAKDE